MTGIDIINAERIRQQRVEGWTPRHDDENHQRGELAQAANCYEFSADGQAKGYDAPKEPPSNWPWGREWWKPTTILRDLTKAGALYMAEAERIDRLEIPNGGEYARQVRLYQGVAEKIDAHLKETHAQL